MSPEPCHYYCPQCGYDLRGQTVDRCPECGLHYDMQAIRDLTWGAFWASYDPYLRAVQVLAPAGIIAIGVMIVPERGRDPGLFLALLLLGILLIVSSRLIESWILGSLRRDYRDTGWLGSSLSAAYRGLVLFLVFVVRWRPVGLVVAVLGFVAGIACVVWGLAHAKPEPLPPGTSVRAGILERARTAIWLLLAADAAVLMLLGLTY